MFPNKHRERLAAHRPGEIVEVASPLAGRTAHEAAEQLRKGCGESDRPDGKILQVSDHLEDAIESALEQIAKLADSIEPVLSEEKVATADFIGVPAAVIISEGDSAVAQRLNDLTNRVLEAARTIEALRRRVQL